MFNPDPNRDFSSFMKTLMTPAPSATAPTDIEADEFSFFPPEYHESYEDGERTDALTTIAGSLIAKGLPLPVVIDLALGWNQGNIDELPESKVHDTCRSIWRTHERNHPKQLKSRFEGEVTPLFPLASASVQRFLSTPPPPRRFLLKDCLPLGELGLLVAPGGTGKSRFAVQLGISVVTGIPLADVWEIGETGSALLLMAEDSEDELHRRLHGARTALDIRDGGDHVEKLKRSLFLKSMVGEDNLLTATDETGEVQRTLLVERLLETVRGIEDLRLIVIDPASRFRGGEENSNEDTTRFVQALEYIAQRTGATILVIHHANKGSHNADEASQNASRGASALTDGVRWQMNLNRPPKNEAKALNISEEERRLCIMATVTKNNYAAPSDPVVLKLADGGHLTKLDVKRIAESKEEADVIRVLRCVAQLEKAVSSRELQDRHGGVKGEIGISVAKIRKAVTLAAGKEYLTYYGAGRVLHLTDHGKRYLDKGPELPEDVAMRQVETVFAAKKPK